MALLKKGFTKDTTPLITPERMQMLEAGYGMMFELDQHMEKEDRLKLKKKRYSDAANKVRK